MIKRYAAVADQILNSASNFLLVILVAMVAAPTEFGSFSVAYAILIFFLGGGRALIGETVLVRLSGTSREVVPTREIAGTWMLFALLSGLAVPLATVVGVLSLWQALVLACCAFMVVMQDSFRYIALVRRQPFGALLIDAVWTVPSVTGMTVAAVFDLHYMVIVGVWGAGALLSVVVAVVYLDCVPKPIAGIRWFWGMRSSAGRYFGEYSALNLSNLVVWFALVPFVSITGIAGLRGAQTLFSPLNTAFNAVRIAMIPELVSAGRTALFKRRMLELSALLIGGCVVWVALMFVVPEVGGLVLGETWGLARGLVPLFALQYLFMSAYTILLSYFRARRLDRSSTVMRGLVAVLTLLLPVSFAVGVGTPGAAWGLAVAVGVGALAGAGLVLMRKMRPTE